MSFVGTRPEVTKYVKKYTKEEDVKLFVDHISVICLLYNMFFKKECFAQEQEYRMVFLCVHKREHQVPENSIPVEYRIKDEVFIPFIRMKLGDARLEMGAADPVGLCSGNGSYDLWNARRRHFMVSYVSE